MKIWAAYIFADNTSFNRTDADWLDVSLENVFNEVDSILIIDGCGSKLLNQVVDKWNQKEKKIITIYNKYPGTDAQRNMYLDFIPKGDWILVVDCDEVISDNAGRFLKEIVKNGPTDVYDLRTHHFVYNLAFEDTSAEKHYTRARFFKNKEGLYYPESKHAPLQGYNKSARIDQIRIYHYSLAKQMLPIYKKFVHDVKAKGGFPRQHSYLWKNNIFSGSYPMKKANIQHPKPIRKMIADTGGSYERK
ncbi:MAG: glycosyltransferase family 2 protein [Candidatus Aenigmatarchaeota archaeon]